jgi:thymidylate synthase
MVSLPFFIMNDMFGIFKEAYEEMLKAQEMQQYAQQQAYALQQMQSNNSSQWTQWSYEQYAQVPTDHERIKTLEKEVEILKKLVFETMLERDQLSKLIDAYNLGKKK